jgi:hypothetical protein
MGLWKMTTAGPEPVKFAALDLEQRLEDMIVKDPSILGLDLLVIDRQVQTDYGAVIGRRQRRARPRA